MNFLTLENIWRILTSNNFFNEFSTNTTIRTITTTISTSIGLSLTDESTSASGSDSDSARLDIPVSKADAAMYGILGALYIIYSGIHIFAIVVNVIQDIAIRKSNRTKDNQEGRRSVAISIQSLLLAVSIMRVVKMFMRVGYTLEGINIYALDGVSHFYAFLTVIPYALFVTALTLVTSSWFNINLYSERTRAQRIVQLCNILANAFNYLVLTMACLFIVVPAAEDYTGTASMIYFTCISLLIIAALILFILGASRLIYLVKTSAISKDNKFKASMFASVVSMIICITMLIRIAFFFSGSLENSTPLRFVGYLFEQVATMTIVALYFKSRNRDMFGNLKSLALEKKAHETELQNEKEFTKEETNEVDNQNTV